MDKKQMESYLTREINLIIQQIEASSHYQKRYLEGALSGFKKCQAKLREFKE